MFSPIITVKFEISRHLTNKDNFTNNNVNGLSCSGFVHQREISDARIKKV